MNATPEIQAKLDDFQDMFAPEELISELKSCITYRRFGSNMVKVLFNEFVHEPFYTEGMHKHYNGRYRQQVAAVAKAVEEKDWNRAIFLRERPYRLQAFIQYWPQMDDASYWSCLRDIWIDAENPGINRKHWLMFFTDPRPGRREHMMEEGERNYLDTCYDPLTIYRGAEQRYRSGLSWTVNEKRARWFAGRWSRGGRVFVATVCKNDVIAYLDGRGEMEIIVDPRKLKIKPLDN